MVEPVSGKSLIGMKVSGAADVATRANPVQPKPSGASDLNAASKAAGIAKALSQSAPVDSNRVEALKAAIKAGNYPVRPQAIADAMIASIKK